MQRRFYGAILVAAVALGLHQYPAAGEAAPAPKVGSGAESFALFGDMTFRQGFALSFSSSAQGRGVEKVVATSDREAQPAWRLCQWATRRSLADAPLLRLPDGDWSYENETKRVVIGQGDPSRPDLILEVRGGAEYQGRAREAGQSWPHLLIEQDAARVVPLAELARLDLQVSLRLCTFKDHLGGRADPSLHAAQFQLFFIVKEVAPGGGGDFFWFGVPFFDSRSEYPPPHRAKDGGKDDATGKFIYTMDGKDVLPAPLARGEWVEVRRDLLPAIVEGLAFTAANGYLPSGDPSRYAVVNMNMGWEIPGAFDAGVEVRGFAIAAVPRAAASAPPDRRADWPEFRGPRGDGSASPPDATNPIGLPLEWSETKNVVWKTPIPHRGWSTPVVSDGQVWLTTATRDGNDFFAVCVDAKSGAVLDSTQLFHADKPEPLGNGVNAYASPSPAIEPGRVYVHFGSYGTACLDTGSRKVVWSRRDLPCRHYRGPGSSAFLFRDFLILTMDGVDVQYLVALDKRTGATVWKTDRTTQWNDIQPDGKPFDNGDLRKAYTTPLLIDAGGTLQLLSVGARSAYSYDPLTGRELWKVHYDGFSNASRPVFGHGLAILSTGSGDTEFWAVRVDGRGDVTDTHVAWKRGQGAPRIPSPVLAGDLLFAVDDSGRATCIEATTGKELWNQRIGGDYAASLLHADGRIYCFNQTGKTTVFKAARAYELLATNALEAGFMASPAVAGKALILRTKTHLYRIETREAAPDGR